MRRIATPPALLLLLACCAAGGPGPAPPTFAPASSGSLASAFKPNARVCVRFDLQGHAVAAAVDGRLSDQAVNRQMLALLRRRVWDPPPPEAAGRWIALAVAPDGSPVPEALPDCRRLPR